MATQQSSQPNKGTTPDVRTREQKQEAFLDALAEHVTITAACKVSIVNRTTVYEWLAMEPAFKASFDRVNVLAVDRLEDEAHRRAFEGYQKPIYQGGIFVGYEQVYSDSLMGLLLKAKKPKTYNQVERKEISGPDGGPIETKDVTTIIEL